MTRHFCPMMGYFEGMEGMFESVWEAWVACIHSHTTNKGCWSIVVGVEGMVVTTIWGRWGYDAALLSLLFLNGWLTVYIKIFMDLLLMASQVEQFRESLGDVWIFYCTSSLTFPFKPPHQSLAIQGLAYISIRKMTWWGLANKNIMWYLTSITGGRGHDKALLLRVSCATWIGWCVLVGINAWLVCWIVGLITSPELGIGTWQKMHHIVEPLHNSTQPLVVLVLFFLMFWWVDIHRSLVVVHLLLNCYHDGD